jgi:hypothetical protein
VTKKTLSDFEQVIFADFEFIAKPGERPDVVCLAWHVAGQTYRLWRDQLSDRPPYRKCCSYVSWATLSWVAIL